MTFANGENVGAYRIVEKLGQGGMATVYKAYHAALDRYVAIKVMHPAFMEDPNFLARFQREARIVAKLDHPNIIPIYDFAEHNGHPYLVMRFVEGETLKARIDDGPLEKDEILRITQAVGEALTYAHKQGILHRDIKPSNVLLTPDGGVYLTDFGLARMAEAGESTLSRDMMVGTPQYISPEQAKGIRELDARTDVYSLGVVLYELLVGRAPFTADTPYAIIHDHIFTPLPLPRQLNPDLPEPIERVLLKALAKEPADRFQSVEELIAALESAIGTAAKPKTRETVVVPPPTRVMPAEAAEMPKEKEPRKKRHWPWLVAAAAAVVCIAVLCLLVAVPRLKQRQQQQQTATAATVGPEEKTAKPEERTTEQLLKEARTAAEENNIGTALDLYQQAVEADPHLTPAYIEASTLLLKQNNVDGAIDALMRGVEANPDDPELHATAAGTALLVDRLDVAQKEIEWMLQEMGDQPLTHAFDGTLILLQGHPCLEARPALDKALRGNPDLPWAHYGMALCSMQEGDLEAARGELDFVLEHEKTPALLRAHAEKTSEELDKMLSESPPPEGNIDEAITQEFEALMALASEISNDELRSQFKERIDQAHRDWVNGNKDASIQMVKETITWVQDNQEGIGKALSGVLLLKLRRIVRLSNEM
jgi:tRNA A-37 threonylcarbamoyl transferase component Bud32/tetratricopeptide (TPR) repeat protein